MKRFSLIMAVCLIVSVSILVGCSASVEQMPDASGDVEESGTIVNGDLNRKIVYSVSIKLNTTDVVHVKNNITEKCTALGGYVEENRESYDDGVCDYVTITYRIPTEKLDEFVDSIEGNGKIDSKNVSTTDITTTYVDAEAEKNALLERKDILSQMLNEDGITTSDKLSIVNELTEVNTSLQKIELILKEYDSKINYSTVSLTIDKIPPFWEDLIPAFIFLVLPMCIGGFFIIRGAVRRKKRARMANAVQP